MIVETAGLTCPAHHGTLLTYITQLFMYVYILGMMTKFKINNVTGNWK